MITKEQSIERSTAWLTECECYKSVSHPPKEFLKDDDHILTQVKATHTAFTSKPGLLLQPGIPDI